MKCIRAPLQYHTPPSLPPHLRHALFTRSSLPFHPHHPLTLTIFPTSPAYPYHFTHITRLSLPFHPHHPLILTISSTSPAYPYHFIHITRLSLPFYPHHPLILTISSTSPAYPYHFTHITPSTSHPAPSLPPTPQTRRLPLYS